MAQAYPASPALSACDSLDGIEDLDAFLEARGKLSRWPTPPPAVGKKPEVVVTRPCEDSDMSASGISFDNDDDEDDGELWRLASAFTHAADEDPSYVDIDHVLMILLRAEVPPEVLALAYNILRVVALEQDVEHFPTCDLAVAACLSLATTFLQDHPPDGEYWARRICKGIWSVTQIDMCVLDFLAHPHLQMLSLSSEAMIDQTMLELRDIALDVKSLDSDDDDVSMASYDDPVPNYRISPESDRTSVPDKAAFSDRRPTLEPLKVATSNSARWLHGAITPTETPTETPVVEPSSWLRLL